MDKFIASKALEDLAASEMTGLEDWTDAGATVSLITTGFTASREIDQATIPANTTEMPVLTSVAAPAFIETVDPPGFQLLWEDPLGGWTFLSDAGTYPQTVSGYRVDSAAGNFLGCQNIPPQIIDGPGRTVVLGEVRLPISPTIFEGL